MSQSRQAYHQAKMLDDSGQPACRRLLGSQPHKNKPQAATVQQVKITASQLPLCCPLPEQRVWDAHPRVYLELNPQQQAICPYCATCYILED